MKNLKLLLMALLCSFMVGCNDDDSKTLNGASDGGGGIVEGSTPQDIREAVTFAREALKREMAMLIIGNFVDDAQFDDTRASHILTRIFIPIIGAQEKLTAKLEELGWNDPNKQLSDEEFEIYDQLIDEALSVPVNLADFIDTIPIEFVDDGPCPAPYSKNADASVSAFTLNAKMCFSLKTLQRIPIDSLHQHVTGLFMHELTHMSGFSDESEARAIEKITNLAFRELVGGTKNGITNQLDYSLMATFNALNGAKGLQINTTYYASLSPQDLALYVATGKIEHLQRVYQYLGAAFASVQHFVYSFDEQNTINKIFYAPSVEEQRKIVIQDAKMLLQNINSVLILSPADMVKSDVAVQMEQLLVALDRVQKGFDEIRSAYEPQSTVIKP